MAVAAAMLSERADWAVESVADLTTGVLGAAVIMVQLNATGITSSGHPSSCCNVTFASKENRNVEWRDVASIPSPSPRWIVTTSSQVAEDSLLPSGNVALQSTLEPTEGIEGKTVMLLVVHVGRAAFAGGLSVRERANVMLRPPCTFSKLTTEPAMKGEDCAGLNSEAFETFGVD